ncbi:tautomerase family protein [Orrella marina]|uniref:Tautomerase n=1 Tax=Orrella marina TaxID=2163011 RepID=A0A2R4XQ27_9BURK|nr:tautomerase family protein [Orrella marina]AWB35875.1 tautomerase [Orrella marina]
MPVLNVSLIKGYDAKTRQALGESLTSAVLQVIDAAPEAIVVCINELDEQNYYRGGQARRAGLAKAAPMETVRAFLHAMQDRDLAKARTYLAPEFKMTFPGDATMTRLEDLVEFSRLRYRFVQKTFESFDTSWKGDVAVVHCHGTLNGEALDGIPFKGVRFIDRFELQGTLIVRQQVWNDLAIFLNTPGQSSTPASGASATR